MQREPVTLYRRIFLSARKQRIAVGSLHIADSGATFAASASFATA